MKNEDKELCVPKLFPLTAPQTERSEHRSANRSVKPAIGITARLAAAMSRRMGPEQEGDPFAGI